MKAVMLEVPEHLLQERSRLGHDIRDEMWEGVLHMVPQPLTRHQRLEALLLIAFAPPAEARGLWSAPETSVFPLMAGWSDYRVPDLVFARSEHVSERGVEGHAELVVEIRSPGDETYDKLPFYRAVGCREGLVIDRDTLSLELFDAAGARTAGDEITLESLGVTIRRVDATKLVVVYDGTETEIVPS